MYDKNVCYESGSVYLNNVEINKDSRGKEISLLFQNPNSYLNPLMKVGEQIDEMLIYHFNENKKTAKEKAIEIKEKAEDLYVSAVYVDSARMLKRLRPAPQGRGYRVRKRSNHVTLFVDKKNTNDNKI